MFDWDRNNLRKIRAHSIKPGEVEAALGNAAILAHVQDAGSELRLVYYGETNAYRLIAIVVTERADLIRVVTAYDLDAGQKRDYLQRRMRGE